jgi:hypothetical protein
MRFRLKAFGLHLLGSASALTLILGGLYLGWYRWPGWYLAGVLRVLVIVLIVDLALGPTLTLIIANPRKKRRELARDIAIIVAVQIVALGYGATTLWRGRPLYYTFSTDRLEMVQASELDKSEVDLARRQNPKLAPRWNSLPRWVWAPLPDDPGEATKIVNGAIFGGKDVIDMPRYFQPWERGLSQLHDRLSAVGDLKSLSNAEKQTLTARMAAVGLDPKERNVILMWGDVPRVLVVFNADATRIKAILKPD